MRINHNISAQLANANLRKADRRLASSLQKLSSGYRINHAADDSAGLAISNKMRTQIRALDQSSRNADDGQSVIQTAEGSLSEIHSLLQRTRELSVQAANDTNTVDDRATAQKEIDSLLDEIDRIASTTNFNGKSLLDGSASRTMIPSSADVKALEVSMEVPAGSYRFEVTQLADYASINGIQYTIPSGDDVQRISINGVDILLTSRDTDATVEEKVKDTCGKMNLDVTNFTAGSFNLASNAVGSKQKISVEINSEELADSPAFGKDAEIQLETSDYPSGTCYSADGNNVTIKNSNGFNMLVSIDNTAGAAADVGNVTLDVYDAGYMKLQIGANEHQTMDLNFPSVNCITLELRDSNGNDIVNVCSQSGASNAIAAMDVAIAKISEARSRLGAYSNRLEGTTSSLDITSENMTESMSRIMDTDMASAMTDYTQQNVMTQAATSMLAQANSRPQQIMSLLQA